jgi:hypothetical protein
VGVGRDPGGQSGEERSYSLSAPPGESGVGGARRREGVGTVGGIPLHFFQKGSDGFLFGTGVVEQLWVQFW